MENSDNLANPTRQKTDQIDALLEKSELRLDEAGKTNATHAFNLGCMIGLIPAGIIVIIALIATRSWLASVLTALLMIVALIGLANLLALIARSNAMERVYKDEVGPDIKNNLLMNDIPETEFNKYAWQHVSPTSNIYIFLPKPPEDPSEGKKKRRIKLPFFDQKK